ncbi:hypothetical protein LQE96_02260 [Phocea massiliensis]|uniref:hypothetical protein n=1 Tax=Merdimmobilis hominis TaxID=2897707 RepID=UPI001E36DEAA|nr:hypothetical protein [Merdimmobilis hominis]MCD4835660.1 hypothetical protein [Merdimmobilis hominis]
MNNDLISRKALLEYVKDLPTWWDDGVGGPGMPMKYPNGMFDCDDIVSSIENAPAVDAVEVVRCKDCIYAQERYGHLKCELGISISNTWNNPNMFCSYGERRENNG